MLEKCEHSLEEELKIGDPYCYTCEDCLMKVHCKSCKGIWYNKEAIAKEEFDENKGFKKEELLDLLDEE